MGLFMALLATLEGETGGISLNDLFDVNDFLGIRYFGPEKWDKIKKCACIITSNAANNPTLFFLSNLKKDVPANSSNLGACLMGYNDVMGRRCMGAPAWNAVKNKIDCELLGWNPISAVKEAVTSIGEKAGEVLRPATNVTKKILDTPMKVYSKVINAIPGSQYNPVTQLYNKYTDTKEKFVDNPTKEALQQTLDTTSGVVYKIATESPLKYLPTAQIIAATEKAKETANITSPGTAAVYPTEAEAAAAEAEKKKKKAAAAAAAWSQAQASANASIEKQKIQKQAAEAQAEAIAAQQEAEALQQNLQQTQQTLSNKYAPWVLAGCGALLALAILKK